MVRESATRVIAIGAAPEARVELEALLESLEGDPAAVVVAGAGALGMDEVRDGTPLSLGARCTMPAGAYVSLRGGSFALELPEPGAPFFPLDALYGALALDGGERVIGILLPGAGLDGVAGLDAVAAAGGVTYALAPASELVRRSRIDAVLSQDALVERVRAIPEGEERVADDVLAALLAHLRDVTGHDFARSSRAFVRQRVARRARALAMSAHVYVRHVLDSRTEARWIAQDLRRRVRRFFEHPDALSALSTRVLPELVRASVDEPLRVWVVGCGAGEEAYTIGLLVSEAVADRSAQIFATDLERHSLEQARRGIFAGSIARELSPERLRRGFVRVGERYRVDAHIRNAIIFSTHDLARDPPFAKMHLVIARGVLERFEPDVHRVVLGRLHRALRPGGCLVVSPSDRVGVQLFAPVEPALGIYERALASFHPDALPPATSPPQPSGAPVGWLRATFERTREAIAVVDPSGRIVHANRALSALFEEPLEQLVGSMLVDRLSVEDREAWTIPSAPTERSRRYLGPLGRALAVRETVSPLTDPAGGPAWAIAMLEEHDERLASLGPMAAVVTHEVRNALAGIRSAVEVIGHGLPPSSEERRAVDEVRRRITDLDECVGHLLRFAQPRAPEPRALSVHAVLTTVAARLESDDLAARLEVSGADAWVSGDPELLTNALLDVCVNAAQAGGRGTVVQVVVDARDGAVEVRIEDRGPGIPPELRGQVFEPFFTTRTRGVGLGLTMARRIVEAHGGQLSIARSDPRGTVVAVRLRPA